MCKSWQKEQAHNLRWAAPLYWCQARQNFRKAGHWASKKSTHFNENQKNYLDEKFKLGQETGYKEDPSQVARDMRRAKNENGERQFAVGEFLSQQIKSYSSRSAAKIKTGGDL